LVNHYTKKRCVYVVHSVDTEGPLSESLESTFARIESLIGMQFEPSIELLEKIQNETLPLNGKEKLASKIFSKDLLDYNDSWEKLDRMLYVIMSNVFRNHFLDSRGTGYKFSWHCVDHVGYVSNPRKKDLGHHKIFDHYKKIIEETNSTDQIHWHFHPMSFYKESHRSGFSYENSPHLHEVICRKIIERNWFPTVFRAGFHVERPDIHLFLEQWIPFDISNMSSDDDKESQLDLQNGRFGNWNFAPNDWSIYHPDHDNYQLVGNCRRYIARILNLGTRYSNITQLEVDKAFSRANSHLPTILGVTNHDFRNIQKDVVTFYEMLIKSKEKFPDVEFVFCDAKEAFRNAIYGEEFNFPKVELNVNIEKKDSSIVLKVDLLNGQVFGPQPYLAVKTKTERFFHDNLDLIEIGKKWAYTFDNDTIIPEDISIISISCNDKYGNNFIKTIEIENL